LDRLKYDTVFFFINSWLQPRFVKQLEVSQKVIEYLTLEYRILQGARAPIKTNP